MPKPKLVTYRFSCASQWTVKLPEGVDPETLSDQDLTAFAKGRRLVEVAIGVVENPERLTKGGEWEPTTEREWDRQRREDAAYDDADAMQA